MAVFTDDLAEAIVQARALTETARVAWRRVAQLSRRDHVDVPSGVAGATEAGLQEKPGYVPTDPETAYRVLQALAPVDMPPADVPKALLKSAMQSAMQMFFCTARSRPDQVPTFVDWVVGEVCGIDGTAALAAWYERSARDIHRRNRQALGEPVELVDDVDVAKASEVLGVDLPEQLRGPRSTLADVRTDRVRKLQEVTQALYHENLRLRRERNAMANTDPPWVWEDTSSDDLQSMGEDMAVRITAGQLRRMLHQAAVASGDLGRGATEPAVAATEPEGPLTALIAGIERQADALARELRTRCRAILDEEDWRPIAEAIRSQNNCATDQPIFIVQQRETIVGVDPDYGYDHEAWVDEDDPEIEYHGAGDIPEGAKVRRVYERHRWAFVTACFTRAACEQYIVSNRHRLNTPRVYAESSYRNREWRQVRALLLELLEGAELAELATTIKPFVAAEKEQA